MKIPRFLPQPRSRWLQKSSSAILNWPFVNLIDLWSQGAPKRNNRNPLTSLQSLTLFSETGQCLGIYLHSSDHSWPRNDWPVNSVKLQPALTWNRSANTRCITHYWTPLFCGVFSSPQTRSPKIFAFTIDWTRLRTLRQVGGLYRSWTS